MKAVIDKLWENEDRKGKRYLVLDIAGERYSLWDEQLMDGVEEGMVIEYDWKQAGKYKNISSLKADPAYSATARAHRKDRDVVRMSCLKSAAALMAEVGIEPERKGDLTLDLARKFERYITDEK